MTEIRKDIDYEIKIDRVTLTNYSNEQLCNIAYLPQLINLET